MHSTRRVLLKPESVAEFVGEDGFRRVVRSSGWPLRAAGVEKDTSESLWVEINVGRRESVSDLRGGGAAPRWITDLVAGGRSER